jgi:hypothetical protein
VHGGVFLHLSQVCRGAFTLIDEFNKTNNGGGERPPNITNIQNVLWQPPSPGTIKINWDVGFDKANGRIGLGMIAYDYKGFVLAARI